MVSSGSWGTGEEDCRDKSTGDREGNILNLPPCFLNPAVSTAHLHTSVRPKPSWSLACFVVTASRLEASSPSNPPSRG